MRKTKNSTNISFAIIFSVALCLASCGRNQTAPLSEGGENLPAAAAGRPVELPLDQQTEHKLEPLTKDEVDLYMKVMRAAAERVKNRAAADQATLADAKKILASGAAGRAPTPDGVKTLARANLLAISMDQIVAEEMKLDGRTYRGVTEAVEAVIPNPFAGKPAGEGAQALPEHPPTPLEKKLSEVNAANKIFLAPYQEEIRSLIQAVRNPLNLPQ